MIKSRVVVFPKFSSGNAYQENFYRPLINDGWAVLEWDLVFSLRRQDILHIHWPEAWSWASGWKRRRILVYVFFLPILKKMCGFKVINTVHNLAPHGKVMSRLGRWVYPRLINCCDAFIHMSVAGKAQFLVRNPHLTHKVHEVIPHPDYRPQLSNLTREEARDQLALMPHEFRVVLFGAIRENKGVGRLIDSFIQSAGDRASLWIGGKCQPEMERELRSKIACDSRIEFNPQFIDDQFMELQVKAADLVVLPYTSSLNSGVIVYALSCGAHVLAPESAVFRELDLLIGGGHVSFFKQDHFFDELKRILKFPRAMHSDPANLDALFGAEVQLKLLDFFVSLRNGS